MNKLRNKLLLTIVIAFICSVLLYLFLEFISDAVSEQCFNNENFIQKENEKVIHKFKEFISDSKIKTDDFELINQWVKAQKYLNLYLFKENKLVFSSNTDYPSKNEFLISLPIFEHKKFYTVVINNQSIKVYIEPFYDYKYYSIFTFSNLFLAFICFVSIILFHINKIISYISLLENEIKIVEGGNLDYAITLKGSDELSSLALSIDEMRKSFNNRLINDALSQKENQEIITALAHDLRTPLTALVGYLDIIEFGRYKDQSALMRYLHISREKSYQIKQFSDKLFEYFMVTTHSTESLDFEIYDGFELFHQLIDERIMTLTETGFSFETSYENKHFYNTLNLLSIHRLFDNIFSNIQKYGDFNFPVKISMTLSSSTLCISFENTINSSVTGKESTHLGLKISRKIVEHHGGLMLSEKINSFYVTSIYLPTT